MCVNCVGQGIAYLGGAVGGLQLLAARARATRRRSTVNENRYLNATSVAPVEQPANPCE